MGCGGVRVEDRNLPAERCEGLVRLGFGVLGSGFEVEGLGCRRLGSRVHRDLRARIP